jgi:hypothetical protein
MTQLDDCVSGGKRSRAGLGVLGDPIAQTSKFIAFITRPVPPIRDPVALVTESVSTICRPVPLAAGLVTSITCRVP